MLKRMITAALTICVGVAIGVLLAVAGHSSRVVDAMPPQSAVAPGSSIPMPPQSTIGAAPVQQPGVSGSTSQQDGYYIRDYNGRVAVLRQGNEVPEMIFDIQTKMLPELDRAALAQGIFVASYEEMLRMVEDYIS